MKRIRFYAVLALFLLFAAALLFWRFPMHQAGVFNPRAVTTINSSTQTSNTSLTGSNISSNQKAPYLKEETDKHALPPEIQKLAASIRANSEKNTAERSQPIAFYGKVLDEALNAVAGANIHFMWVDPISTSETNTTSASDGKFSLLGVVGGTVNLDVWKDGYYEAKSHKQFNYDSTGNGSSFDNPVLIYLRKKGAGVDLISTSLNVQIPRDGTVISVDLLNQQVGINHQLQVSQIKPPYDSWRKATEWSFHMMIVDGGLVEENEEFPFNAPENGYKSKVEFDFKSNDSAWQTSLKKSYYFYFGNPRRYGHLELQTDIMWGGARIDFAINPNGLRNLEPKQSQ